MLSTAETLARLRLIRSENVGPVTFRQLLARFGSGTAAIAALPDLAHRVGRKALRVATAADAEAEIAAIARAGARLIHWGVAPYPSRLAEIEDAPPVMVAMGDLRLFDRPAVALIGARNASAAGQKLARDWAGELAEAGLAVVSGLARGIDAAAHRGAPDASVAAVAGGADVFYPPELEPLQRELGQRGLILAEQPLGTEPQARHFPRRNRIISGLSLGVVVIEAALRSGSLITARYAAEQGREVMAAPGHPLDPRSHGGNGLIREGATLVGSVAEVLEAVQPFQPRAPSVLKLAEAVPEPGPADAAALEALLGAAPVGIDELVRSSGMPLAQVQAVLVDLELGGRLVRHAGWRVSLA